MTAAHCTGDTVGCLPLSAIKTLNISIFLVNSPSETVICIVKGNLRIFLSNKYLQVGESGLFILVGISYRLGYIYLVNDLTHYTHWLSTEKRE